MTADTALFEAERPALTALCYRMLGERAGAEDPDDVIALCGPCHTQFHKTRTLSERAHNVS